MNIRLTKSGDIPGLILVVRGTGLFPAEMLPDMVGGFLTEQGTEDIWLTFEDDGTAVGFCYAAPEQLTEGTWNMLAIAVLPSKQGEGVGAAMVNELEAMLRKRGQRVLIADTSGTDAFMPTRQFYRKNGYTEEARIRGFWAAGDDKVTFWKEL